MSVTYSFTKGLFRGSLGFSKTVNKVVDAEAVIDDTLAASQANKIYNVPVDVSRVTALGIMASKDTTLKINSNTAPSETLDLKANDPVLWYSGDSTDNPLATDVATWHATNLATEEATLQVFVGYEPT